MFRYVVLTLTISKLSMEGIGQVLFFPPCIFFYLIFLHLRFLKS